MQYQIRPVCLIQDEINKSVPIPSKGMTYWRAFEIAINLFLRPRTNMKQHISTNSIKMYINVNI